MEKITETMPITGPLTKPQSRLARAEAELRRAKRILDTLHEHQATALYSYNARMEEAHKWLADNEISPATFSRILSEYARTADDYGIVIKRSEGREVFARRSLGITKQTLFKAEKK